MIVSTRVTSYPSDTASRSSEDEFMGEFDDLVINLPSLDCNDLSFPSPAVSQSTTQSPSNASCSSSSPPRRRRKREAIELPENVSTTCDAKELKKIKNRIAAARLRERSQQRIRDLEAEVTALRERNAFLETHHCRCASPHHEGASSSLAADSPVPVAAPTPQRKRCESPSSLDDEDSPATLLAEFDRDLVHQLLWQSEELNTMM